MIQITGIALVFIITMTIGLFFRRKLKYKTTVRLWLNIFVGSASLIAILYNVIFVHDYALGLTEGINKSYFKSDIVFLIMLLSSSLYIWKYISDCRK